MGEHPEPTCRICHRPLFQRRQTDEAFIVLDDGTDAHGDCWTGDEWGVAERLRAALDPS